MVRVKCAEKCAHTEAIKGNTKDFLYYYFSKFSSGKMGARILLVIVVLAVCLEYILAAPNPNPSPVLGKQELVQRFVEFLKEDPEFINALDNIDSEDHLIRNRRQATRPMEPEDFDNADKQPGFFDRAAKFVTELLQRFLKWINNSDNN